MRMLSIFIPCITLGACAFPTQVQRFGVEYNTALAEMNNEQTLLNILRARDGMPTHFTSVSQFRGNINLTAGASLNGQLRGSGLTQALTSGFTNTAATTNTATTNVAAPGAPPSTSTVVSAVTTPVANGSTNSTIAEGVDLYTPQISGQLVSGTAFDVAVFDTQKFFNGILSAISFGTIETLLPTGLDNRVLMHLTIARVDVRLAEGRDNLKKGTLVRSFVNDPDDDARTADFNKFVNCYQLGSTSTKDSTTKVTAMSRVTRGPDQKAVPLALEDLTLIDGERFALTGEGLGDEASGDAGVYLTRLKPGRRVPQLSQRAPSQCATMDDRTVDVTLPNGKRVKAVVPDAPTAAPIYVGDGFAALGLGGAVRLAEVSLDITFRSPEGLYRYLGMYLSRSESEQLKIGGAPLFSITPGRVSDALANASHRGKDYSLVNGPGAGVRNARVFTLLQQLINLHKEASERATTIPVRAVP